MPRKALAAKEGVIVSDEEALAIRRKRQKLDQHMADQHPEHPWTPALSSASSSTVVDHHLVAKHFPKSQTSKPEMADENDEKPEMADENMAAQAEAQDGRLFTTST